MRSTVLIAALALGLMSSSLPDIARADVAADCAVEDVIYTVAAKLRITGTVLGAGDGDHLVGPGKVVLQFAQGAGRRRAIRMTGFELRQRFTVVSKVMFWATSVLSDIETTAVVDAPAVVAEGFLENRSLHWTRVPGALRDDGTLLCTGPFCGKFGAPPSGKSGYHAGPSPMQFATFEFSDDMKTFTMAPVLASKSEDPKQESYLTLAGREVKRSCSGASP
jgi:hypothetical protein